MTELVNLKFAKVRPEGIIPSKRLEDAGYDVYVDWGKATGYPINVRYDYRAWDNRALVRTTNEMGEVIFFILFPHETFAFPTGIASSCGEDYYFQIQERGSTGSKGIKYGAGCLDSGYRGEWFIPITNANNKPIVFYDDKKISLRPEDREIYEEQEYENLYQDELWVDMTGKPFRYFRNDDFIFYPMSKAIAQFLLLPVPKTKIEEISFEELQKIPSERGGGSLGSSGK